MRRSAPAAGGESPHLGKVPPYELADDEHRIAEALTSIRRLHPAWFDYAYGPDPSIEPGQRDVLWYLTLRFPDGYAMNELAAALRIDPSTATRAVDKLEKRGFVTRSAATSDKRVLVVHVTEDGIKLMREHSFRASKRWRAALHAAIGPDKLGTLADGLERLVQGMETAVTLHPRDEG
jgi:DNA-binding MarR family transcriptional regulator